MPSTKPFAHRVLSAARDRWSDATAAGAVIVIGWAVASWPGAILAVGLVVVSALAIVHRERLLALGARLPGRAGALFCDPGGPQAVDAWWTACDAVRMQPVPPGDGSGIEEWDAEAERRTAVRDEAGKLVSPVRRAMDW